TGGGVNLSRAAMLGNTPNPVSSTTRISFVMPAGAKSAELRVFDASGRQVRSFHDGFKPGLNEIVWDATNEHGTSVSAGMYFYRLNVDKLQFTRKMVVVH